LDTTVNLLAELDTSIDNMNKENRKAAKELEEAKKEERMQQEKLDDEAKELEKMSNKQSMLIKKVSLLQCHFSVVSNLLSLLRWALFLNIMASASSSVLICQCIFNGKFQSTGRKLNQLLNNNNSKWSKNSNERPHPRGEWGEFFMGTKHCDGRPVRREHCRFYDRWDVKP